MYDLNLVLTILLYAVVFAMPVALIIIACFRTRRCRCRCTSVYSTKRYRYSDLNKAPNRATCINSFSNNDY